MNLFNLILLLFVVCGWGLGSVIKNDNVPSQGLYTAEDNVVVLTGGNFKKEVIGRENAWLVEFYNSWCGYCQRFASVWKAFASDIVSWQDLVKIGTIDCSADENIPTCTEYEVDRYPTLKYFHDHYENGTGVTVPSSFDLSEERHNLIKLLIREQAEGRGKIFPILQPYEQPDTSKLFDGSGQVQYTFLITQSANSTIGAEAAMYYHKVPEISIRYAFDNNQVLLNNLNVKSQPSLHVVKRNGPVDVLAVYSPDIEGIRTAVERFLQSKNIYIPKTENNTQSTAISNKPTLNADDEELRKEVKEIGDAVFQGDLESALRYSLTKEVGHIKEIKGEKLDSLRLFIDVLEKYFPLGDNGKKLLKSIKKYIRENDVVSGTEIRKQVIQATDPSKKVFSTPEKWLGCLGSSALYRGYPCSLWKMFHFLTINTALDKEFKFPNENVVLQAMFGYIKHFFGCRECSEHFQSMAQRRHIFEVQSRGKAVMWLWDAHNEVNNRLHGDLTEDPEYPKITFPAARDCPQCYRSDGKWNEEEVLNYLTKMYRKENIKYLGSNKDALVMTSNAEYSITLNNLLIFTTVLLSLTGRLIFL